MKTKFSLIVLLLSACAAQSSAQTGFDATGDGLLYGTYYMRQVFYFVSSKDEFTRAMNVQGTITFNGAGTYSFSGSLLDSESSPVKPATFTNSGSYVISASGEGYITGVNNQFISDKIYGVVSHSVFIGSSTKNSNGYNDLFIAAPVGGEATNATLKGSYTAAFIGANNSDDDTVFNPGDALLTMTADGQGNIGAVNVTGYVGTSSTATTQNLTGVTYSFSNGAAQVNFGGTSGSSVPIGGSKLLYTTPDGNFIFGGSYDGYDMFAGVRAASSAPSNYSGLYYQAGLDVDEADASADRSVLNSYYGSFQAFSGNIIGHKIMTSVSPMKYKSSNALLIYGASSDFTYYDSYALNSDGSSDDSAFSQHYVSSADGTIRIGYGIGPFLSLSVAFQAPSFSGSGVYLNPAGVVNAASSAPFTAFISPGEFLTLYGSGLSPATASASLPYPTILSGVQVLINETPAPIYYVSPTQISIIVPYGTVSGLVARIVVNNNGSDSNAVTQYTSLTSPGVFTNNPVGGVGYAAALHPDNSVISKASPAKIGETVAVYLAGMGQVTPAVQDGMAASLTSFSYTTANPQVYLADSAGNFMQANITFSGLAPGYAGLYQMNFTIPSGLASGDTYLEILGPDAGTFEALLPVTTATSAAAVATR